MGRAGHGDDPDTRKTRDRILQIPAGCGSSNSGLPTQWRCRAPLTASARSGETQGTRCSPQQAPVPAGHGRPVQARRRRDRRPSAAVAAHPLPL
jgi:hypothetical protein